MRVPMFRFHVVNLSGLALSAVLVVSTSSSAAEDQPAASPAPSSAARSAQAEAPSSGGKAPAIAGVAPEVTPDTVVPVPAAPGMPLWQTHLGVDYWKPGAIAAAATLEWHGNVETDIGYASYKFSSVNFPNETFHDFRGRFVLGPVLEHRMANDYFVRGTGQAVMWIRDAVGGKYQINADDVYVQFGQRGVWDLKAGRFMTWTVYRKGLGYDIFTLEDVGALKRPPIEGGDYGTRYEVNTIWYRDINGFGPGRLAFHYYLNKLAGLQLLGQYGRNPNTNENQLGGRGALNVELPHVSIMAGGEYLQIRPGEERSFFDENDNRVVCNTCALTKKYGFGGGAVFRPLPVLEAAVNAARGYELQWNNSDGQPNRTAEKTITGLGGYLQLDVGSLALARPVIIGSGVNNTTNTSPAGYDETHTQIAGYVVYPLGFNNAFVKLVVTKSQDEFVETTGNERLKSDVLAARLRFAMYY